VCSAVWLISDCMQSPPLQARDIAGAPAAAAGVTARLLEAAEAEAALPGLRSRGQPALLLQGGAVVDVRAYLRCRAGK
jgi:hypothetical protein